jgi:hypothetical protein
MRFTDESREAAYQETKGNRLRKIGTETMSHKTSTWDVVAHTGPPRKYEYMLQPRANTAGGREHNVVNGLDWNDHKVATFTKNV